MHLLQFNHSDSRCLPFTLPINSICALLTLNLWSLMRSRHVSKLSMWQTNQGNLKTHISIRPGSCAQQLNCLSNRQACNFSCAADGHLISSHQGWSKFRCSSQRSLFITGIVYLSSRIYIIEAASYKFCSSVRIRSAAAGAS